MHHSNVHVDFFEDEQTLYYETRNPYHECNAIIILVIVYDIDERYSISSEDKEFLIKSLSHDRIYINDRDDFKCI